MWTKLLSNPFSDDRPRVVVTVEGKKIECYVEDEALALTNDVEHYPTGLKPSGRYWLREVKSGNLIFPRKLPR